MTAGLLSQPNSQKSFKSGMIGCSILVNGDLTIFYNFEASSAAGYKTRA